MGQKSKAEVTNNKRLHLRYCTVEANCRQTRSIAQPLCDSRVCCLCSRHANTSYWCSCVLGECHRKFISDSRLQCMDLINTKLVCSSFCIFFEKYMHVCVQYFLRKIWTWAWIYICYRSLLVKHVLVFTYLFCAKLALWAIIKVALLCDSNCKVYPRFGIR